MAQARGSVELKIPAEGEFVVVAKRAAAALGSAAGFSLEGIDELNIAVSQACEKAIAAGQRMWGPGGSVVKVVFRLVEGGLQVDVRTLARLSHEVAEERAERLRAEAQAARLLGRVGAAGKRQPVPVKVAAHDENLDLDQLAVNMIRLFVDELRYNVDSHGSMRMRMVKYLVD